MSFVSYWDAEETDASPPWRLAQSIKVTHENDVTQKPLQEHTLKKQKVAETIPPASHQHIVPQGEHWDRWEGETSQSGWGKETYANSHQKGLQEQKGWHDNEVESGQWSSWWETNGSGQWSSWWETNDWCHNGGEQWESEWNNSWDDEWKNYQESEWPTTSYHDGSSQWTSPHPKHSESQGPPESDKSCQDWSFQDGHMSWGEMKQKSATHAPSDWKEMDIPPWFKSGWANKMVLLTSLYQMGRFNYFKKLIHQYSEHEMLRQKVLELKSSIQKYGDKGPRMLGHLD